MWKASGSSFWGFSVYTICTVAGEDDESRGLAIGADSAIASDINNRDEKIILVCRPMCIFRMLKD